MTTHTATATRTSKMVWTVTCTCGESYKIRQQGRHESVEAHAAAWVVALNAKHAAEAPAPIEFGDGKTVADKTDAELADMLKYWGHIRHPQYVAEAIRAEQARRAAAPRFVAVNDRPGFWTVLDTTQEGYARIEASFRTAEQADDWAARLNAGHRFARPAGPLAPGTRIERDVVA